MSACHIAVKALSFLVDLVSSWSRVSNRSKVKRRIVRLASRRLSFNPRGQFADWNQDLAVALACPQAAKGSRERFLLLRSRELGDQQSMADGDLVFQECLGHGRYEVSQSNTTVNVSLAFSRAGRDTRDSIDRLSEFQKRFETQSFLKRVNVLALEIFNALALDGLGSGLLNGFQTLA
jgi:hypothetical protein